jgi:hypothetical protein
MRVSRKVGNIKLATVEGLCRTRLGGGTRRFRRLRDDRGDRHGGDPGKVGA